MAGFNSLLRALAVSLSISTVLAQNCPNTWGNYDPPVIASGWSAQRLVGGLTFPRHMVFDDQGTLLVVDRGVGVRAVKVNQNGRCVSLQSNNILIQDNQLNHGIALHPNGRLLFASSVNAAWVWDYNPNGPTISNKRQVINNMAFAGHNTRTLLIPRSHPNTLLVQQGSAGNWDYACRAPNGGCNIKEFDITNIPSQPYHYYNSGKVLSWGLRNTVGFDDTSDGQLFSVENSADDLRRYNSQDIHQNNPAEEMNFHGKLGPNNPLAGRGHGYPDCVAIWNSTEIQGIGNLQTGDQFIPNPNATFTDATCNNNFEKPIQVFPAHVAPLDIRFFKPEAQKSDCNTNAQYGGLTCQFKDYAFMSMHGSWNRNGPIGYSLGYIEFKPNAEGDLAPSKPRNDKTAWNPILSPSNFANCPRRCFRPVGVAFDQRGRVFVTSDSPGEIVVLTKN